MIEALFDLPCDLRERLAAALDAGSISERPSNQELKCVLGRGDHVSVVAAGLDEMKDLGVSWKAAARWLRSVASIEAAIPRPDLVWTGPEVPGLHARQTRRVYEELIGGATRSLWISTFAFFDGQEAFRLLAERMDSIEELEVTLLLDVRRKHHEKSSAAAIVRGFTDEFWKIEWPGERKPRVFYDPRSLEPKGPPSVLHAKAVVADDEAVFVTSANLTQSAFDRNIELGLLLRDPTLAAKVVLHLQTLVDKALLHRLPSR